MSRFAIACLAVAFIPASGALAADAIVDVPEAPIFEETRTRSILLGGGAGVAPVYEGSDEYRVFPFPIFSYDSGTGLDGPRRFEFRALDDIRLHALRFGGLSAGPLAGYSFGREEDQADILEGLGDVDAGFVVGGFAAYDLAVTENASVGLDIGISTQVTGNAFDEDNFLGLPVGVRDRLEDGYGYGYTVDFGVSADVDLTPRLNLAARVGAEYASDEYMRTYFGVSPEQDALAPDARISTFDADAGIKNVYVNANIAFDVTDRFQVRAGAGYSHLLNDASDSPISVTDHQFRGSLGAAYRIKF